MNVCIYLRKSRADDEAEERGEEETLARHEKILIEVAKKQKLHISEIYREVVSGETIGARPVVQRLLSEVEQGLWDAVLVMEIERLARGDTIDQGIMAQTFKYSNTKIITPNKTYDPQNEYDEEYFEFSLFMSRREYKTINRRLQRGRLQSIKEGRYVGNTTPYGYQREKLDKDKGFKLVPHPDEAPVVKMIFDWYVNGITEPDGTQRRLGISLIVRRLNDMKIPARKGVWVNSSINSILRNVHYIGKVRWNYRKSVKKMVDGKIQTQRPRADSKEWDIFDGFHEPIISEKLYNIANEYLMKNPPRPNPSQSITTNPLAGVVTCGLCGRKMVRRPYVNRGQAPTLICPITSCKNISSTVDNVETAILEFLKNWVNEYTVELTQESTNTLDVDAFKISKSNQIKELSTLEIQLDNSYNFVETGIYTTDVFLERTKYLTEKIKTIKKNIEHIENEINRINKINESKVNIVPKVQSVLDTYHNQDIPGKNILLKSILEKVVYLKTEKRYKSKIDKFELKVYPKTAQTED